jgi:hypothetical protein
MTTLRRRMMEDMQVRSLLPELLGPEEIRYQVYLSIAHI